MLVGKFPRLHLDVLRRNMAGLGLVALLGAGCSSPTTSWQSGDDSGVSPDAVAPASADSRPKSVDGQPPLPAADLGAPPAQPCAAAVLPLTRFPAAQRTTSGGRTFTGWGGAASAGAVKHPPVIFVHGNGGSADDFKPFRDELCKAGYSDNEIWAVTFQDNDCTGVCSSGSNTDHATELERLVVLVRGQTSAPRGSLVAVSMGVPTARYYIKSLGGITRNEVALAYLVSGPNHGLQACDVAGASFINVTCAELDALALASGWLHDLNTPDETPNGQDDSLPAAKTIIYRTVSYTQDPFFPDSYVSSPKLDGADNQVLPGDTHAAIDPTDLLAYLKKAN